MATLKHLNLYGTAAMRDFSEKTNESDVPESVEMTAEPLSSADEKQPAAAADELTAAQERYLRLAA